MAALLSSVGQWLKRFWVTARKFIAGLLALSVIPAVFSLFTMFLQQHLEHNFLRTSQRQTLLEQTLEKKNQLLGDFVTTSSELLAVRSESLLMHADSTVRSQIGVACEQQHSIGKMRKPSAQTLQSM